MEGKWIGVAILAAVFARNGGAYYSHAIFIHGWKPAMYVASSMAGLGFLFAIMAPGRAAIARTIAQHHSALVVEQPGESKAA